MLVLMLKSERVGCQSLDADGRDHPNRDSRSCLDAFLPSMTPRLICFSLHPSSSSELLLHQFLFTINQVHSTLYYSVRIHEPL